MSFHLRGGRPKNMGQGIYWVRRAVNVRGAIGHSAELAERERIQNANAEAYRFNERIKRLRLAIRRYASDMEEIEKLACDDERVKKALAALQRVSRRIERNIEAACMSDLDDFANRIRKFVEVVSPHRREKVLWLEEDGLLKAGRRRLDLS